MELPAYHLAHAWATSCVQHVGARLVLHQEGRHHHRCCPPFWSGSPPSSGSAPRTASGCWLRTRWISRILAGSRRRHCLDLQAAWLRAPGRQPWHPSPVWLQRKTSSAPWVSSTAASTATSMQALAVCIHRCQRRTPFLVFNLLCAPCFAAIGAIKREMNNAKWTWFAIGYQCGFRLCRCPDDQPVRQRLHRASLNVYRHHRGRDCRCWQVIVYMLVRPYKESTKLSTKV